IAEALGVVKVGNSECGLAKLTPRSRIAAIVGAVAGSTLTARSPSGTNSTTVCGKVCAGFCAMAGTEAASSSITAAAPRLRMGEAYRRLGWRDGTAFPGWFDDSVGTGALPPAAGSPHSRDRAIAQDTIGDHQSGLCPAAARSRHARPDLAPRTVRRRAAAARLCLSDRRVLHRRDPGHDVVAVRAP